MNNPLTLKKLITAAGTLLALSSLSLTAETITVVADGADNQLAEDGSRPWVGNGTLRVGGGSTLDTVGVFPFQLPELPEGESIWSVDFQFWMEKVSNSPGPADVYALPFQDAPEFSNDVFYGGAFDADPNATGVQANILVIDSPQGIYNLSELGKAALTQHIIAQYENGAEAGDWILIRMGPRKENEGNYAFYEVASANHAEPQKRPTLIIETFDGNYAPTLDMVTLTSAEVGQVTEILISGSDLNEEDTLSFSSDELPEFVTLTDNGDRTAKLTIAPVSGDAGYYVFEVTVSDGVLEGSGPVSIVITDDNASGNVPVVADIEPLTIDQGTDLVIDVTVTDADSDTVTISAVNLPDFATFVDNGDLTGTLTLDTWYTDAPGDYTIYFVALDEAGNTGVGTFELTLKEVVFEPGYYIDPVNGDVSNDGSPARPWRTLEEVMAVGTTFQPGDVIFLREGYHGEPTINGSNADYVYIKPYNGERAYMSKLDFGGNSKNWHVSGLEISREFAEEYSKAQIVTINGTYNILADSLIYSVADISEWTADDWNAKSANGVHIPGSHNILEGCTILNTNFATAFHAQSSFNTIRNNHIQNFSGDGIRAIGNDQLVEGNFIADNYNVNDNHDDGIQGWSVGEDNRSGSGVTARVTIRGNVIIETTDPDRPLQGPLQGIGNFDGMFEDWVIENNMIVVNQWHGIALYGAINCRIVNNTVLDQDMFRPVGPTWITIEPHKNWANETDPDKKAYYFGRDNVVANNITTALYKSLNNSYVELKNNIVVNETQFDDYFVNYPYDLRLKPGSPAIDAGDADEATETDILGVARPIGAAPDVGAFEWTGTWNGWDVEDGWISTGAFLGQMYVNYAPWLYNEDGQTWYYFDQASFGETGVWLFAQGLITNGEDAVTDENTWAGWELDGGWAITGIGPIYPIDENWVYVQALGAWTFAPAANIAESGGTWIYPTNGEASDN